MTIQALTQTVKSERRRFVWPRLRGSVFVLNEGKGWGLIAVSGQSLYDLAIQVLGKPDEKNRTSLVSYSTWSNATPYQLADLLYKADKL